MRIAVSGAHQTGKTTLVEELVGSRPEFNRFDEPYYQLETEGHAFAGVLGIEDFELQLERSIQSINESEGDCLFDRCPADILAYLITHADSERFDIRGWLPGARIAMQRLDLVVFVPIEAPDRVPLAATDQGTLRRRVHEELEDIVLNDGMGFGVPAIEVTGTTEERAHQVLEYVRDAMDSR
jgi:hypothetical protein